MTTCECGHGARDHHTEGRTTHYFGACGQYPCPCRLYRPTDGDDDV